MNVDSTSEVCPYLGSHHDPDSHFAYPHTTHHCYAQDDAQPIDLTFQSKTCLRQNWMSCPRYRHTSRAGGTIYPSLVAAAQERRRRERRIALAILGGLVLVITLLAAMRRFAWSSPVPTPPALASSGTAVTVALPAATATTQPALAPAPSATPTATALPSATSTATALPTATSTATALPSATSTATALLSATSTATALPSATPSAIPTATATPTASSTETPAPTVSPTALPWSVVHVAQPGDFVARIAKRYGATVADVVEANELEDPSIIYRGQVLLVPLASAQKALAATPVLTGSRESGGELPLPAPAPNDPAEPTPSGSVELTWRVEQPLEEGQYFALYLWWEEQQAPAFLTLLTKPAYTLDLTDRAAGTYHWAVRVVEGRRDGALQILHRNLSPLSRQISVEWTTP